MKKRLLLAFAAIATAFSGFAHEVDTYVYTPQGRFQITGANVCTNSTLNNLDGFTAVSTKAEATASSLFAITTDGYKEGYSYINALDNNVANQGIYYSFKPASASDIYVVSFAMKLGDTFTMGSTADDFTTRLAIHENSAVVQNIVNIKGNTNNDFSGTENILEACAATQITNEWKNYSFAIVGDGVDRTYYISFMGMGSHIQIADIEIQPAIKVANLKERDAAVNKLKAYKECRNWDESSLSGINEILSSLEGISDGSTQEELDDLVAGVSDVLNEFLPANMEDYLAGNAENYLPAGGKISNGAAGQWTATARVYRSANDYYDIGHYQSSTSWNFNQPTSPMGVYMTKDLTKGSYVFSVDARAAVRVSTSSKDAATWDNNNALVVGDAVLYIKKVEEDGTHVDPTEENSIVYSKYEVDPLNYTNGTISAKIEEDGNYEFGILVYCKEEYRGLKNGSVVYLKDASFWGKNDNKYTQAQLAYEKNVITQITTGRNNITTAQEKIADASKPWGKTALQEAIDTYSPIIAEYEKMTQDDIMATYNDEYVAGPTNEGALLEHEVYASAVSQLIEANREFDRVNGLLATLNNTIASAEKVLNSRIYETATAKETFTKTINDAKATEASLKEGEYSEENEATISELCATLNKEAGEYPATVPAENITSIVDIDFSNAATETDGIYSVAGNKGSMEFSIFNLTQEEDITNAFEIGMPVNGEIQEQGKLRVGNGTGIVTFDAGDMGTNILKVSCDYYFGRLTKGTNAGSGFYVGCYIKDENGNDITGLYYSPYWGEADIMYNPCGFTTNFPTVGQSGVDNLSIAAESNKTSLEFILDFGTKTMYATSSSSKGTQVTEPVAFEGIPTQFVLKSDYNNNNARRCWFDNLKIETIKAGAPTGINNAVVATPANNVRYNAAGQKVDKNYKGLVITKAGKFIQK